MVSSKVMLRPCRLRWSIHVTNIFSNRTMKVDCPDDTLVAEAPAPALKAAMIFSLSFLIVRNVNSGRLSARLMDFPLSYLLIILTFCAIVIVFLLIFMAGGVSFLLKSRLGAMMHKGHKKKRKIKSQTLKRTMPQHKQRVTRAQAVTRPLAMGNERRESVCDLSAQLVFYCPACLPPPYTSQHPIDVTAHLECSPGSLMPTESTRHSFFFFFFTF